MGLDVVDDDQRFFEDEGQGLGGRQSHQERPHESRMRDHGDGRQIVEFHAGFLQRVVDDRQDPLDMRPRGDFRNDTAEPLMNLGLRRDDAGANDEVFVDHRRGRLVARRFDRQQHARK